MASRRGKTHTSPWRRTKAAARDEARGSDSTRPRKAKSAARKRADKTPPAGVAPKRIATPASRKTKTATRKHISSKDLSYCQTSGWEFADVVDGLAIYDSAFKTVHYLNHTAAAVFLLCKDPVGVDVMEAVLREEFQLKTAPSRELHDVLDQMVKAGLLRQLTQRQPSRSKEKKTSRSKK